MDVEEAAKRIFGKYKESVVRECERNKFYTINILESIVESVNTVTEIDLKRDISRGIPPFFSLGALEIESKALYQVILVAAMSIVQQMNVCLREGLMVVCKVILKVVQTRDSKSMSAAV